MNLKHVSRIPQRYKDIARGFARKMQSLFPVGNSYYNIVDLIIHIILLYYHITFDSNLLKDDEKDKLSQLLQRNDKQIPDYLYLIQVNMDTNTRLSKIWFMANQIFYY